MSKKVSYVEELKSKPFNSLTRAEKFIVTSNIHQAKLMRFTQLILSGQLKITGDDKLYKMEFDKSSKSGISVNKEDKVPDSYKFTNDSLIKTIRYTTMGISDYRDSLNN